jgi:hypothetical protein
LASSIQLYPMHDSVGVEISVVTLRTLVDTFLRQL